MRLVPLRRGRRRVPLRGGRVLPVRGAGAGRAWGAVPARRARGRGGRAAASPSGVSDAAHMDGSYVAAHQLNRVLF